MQNCKCSFDLAPLHRSTSDHSFFKFQVPVSHSPTLPDSFSLSPFPGNLKNHIPPIRSVLGETKVRIDSQSQALFFLSNGGDYRQKLSRYSVNLCLSSGYSTITWFAAGVLGIFSKGELCCTALNLCLILLALVLQILQFCIDNEAFQLGLHSWTALFYFQYWDTRKACCILVWTWKLLVSSLPRQFHGSGFLFPPLVFFLFVFLSSQVHCFTS